MKLKRKTIVLCSIGITFLILSTQTTTSVVEKDCIEQEIMEQVDSLDNDIVSKLLNA
jgi:hypothetical protein